MSGLPLISDEETEQNTDCFQCPFCKTWIPNKHLAQHMGSKGGKKSKHYSEAEKERRRKRLARVRPKKKVD